MSRRFRATKNPFWRAPLRSSTRSEYSIQWKHLFMKSRLSLVGFLTFLLCSISHRTFAATPERLRFSSRHGEQSLALRPNANALRLTKKLTPRGAKTVFFGTCRGNLRRDTKSRAGELAVHFYAVQTRRFKVGDYYQRKFALYCDVFAVTTTKNRRQLLRLQHLLLHDKLKCMNGNWALGSDKITGANFLWLDASQNVPILRVKMSGSTIVSFASCDALLIFPKGLRAKPVVQGFESYMTTSEDSRTFFTDRDRRNFLIIRQQQTTSEIDFDKKQPFTEYRQKPVYFDWNGKSFVARRAAAKSSR